MAHRLAVLRLYEADLKLCEDGMHRFGVIRATDALDADLMLAGIVIKLFSCFGANRAQFSLAPEKVFRGRQDAREAFDYWKSLRDKLIAHNENEMTTIATGLVLGEKGDFQDVLSFQARPVLALEDGSNQNLFNLIDHTLKHVVSEIDELLPKLRAEALNLTPQERLALPTVQCGLPSADAASKSRPRPSRSHRGEALPQWHCHG